MHGSGRGWERHLRLALLAGIVIAVLGMAAAPASAHPLGNFTTNRYARVELSAGVLRVYYVLDEAELRAFERRDAIKRDRGGFVSEQVAAIRAGLRAWVDGIALDLVPAPARLDLLPGQAGLDTLRLAVVFSAPLPPGTGTREGRFEDRNEPDRIGWRELVVVGRGDARIETSSAPSQEISDELRSYPQDRLEAPLEQRDATFSFEPGTRRADALELRPPATAATRAGGKLTALIERQRLTLPILAGMLGLAFLFGSAHALGPGHGKTVMAAYLVGTRGRALDAVLLGLIVSLMHTGSVLLLGVALLQLDRFGAIERIYPLLTVVSGVAVAAFAAVLLRRRLGALRAGGPAHGHDEQHDHDQEGGHEHDRDPIPVHETVHARGHGHGEEHGHLGGEDKGHHGHDHAGRHHGGHSHGGHSHGAGGHTHALAEGTAPLSRRGLVLLATSGGLLPSPSAVLVVVAGFGAGRIALGLSIVLAFSVGLAATLSAVGIALVLGRRVIERRGGEATVRLLPVGGALALLAVGLVLLVTGLTELR